MVFEAKCQCDDPAHFRECKLHVYNKPLNSYYQKNKLTVDHNVYQNQVKFNRKQLANSIDVYRKDIV